MNVLLACVSVHHICTVKGTLELELCLLVNYCIGTGNQTGSFARATPVFLFFCFVLFCFPELRTEPRALHLLDKHSTTELNPHPATPVPNRGAVSPAHRPVLKMLPVTEFF